MASVLWVLCMIVKVSTIYGRKGFGPGEQDWGYVTVRPGAHMFWWLYETTADVASSLERPLVIWLQGGPGSASTGYGNFAEIGPLDIELNVRNHTWVKNYNVLFIDNPVGTGFSYVSNLSALTTTNRQIGQDLVVCLDGFFAKREEFRSVPLYVAGESYGGKMAVDFALELHNRTIGGNNGTSLRGICLLDPWISPIDSVLNWAPFLFMLGAVDQNGAKQIAASANQVRRAIEQNQFELARTEWSRTVGIVLDATQGIDFYNVLKKVSALAKNVRPKGKVKFLEDIQIENIINENVTEALQIKDVVFGSQSLKVSAALRGDFMRSVADKVEELLHRTNITIQVVSGQLDLIVDTPGTLKWVDRLRFPKSEKEWPQLPRHILEVNGSIEGYYKTLGRFSLYWVIRSGHMVPIDNPGAMEVIMKHLVNRR